MKIAWITFKLSLNSLIILNYVYILWITFESRWFPFQFHVWIAFKYVWISLESHLSTCIVQIRKKLWNQVSTSSNSPLGSESLSITIESLIIKFQFRVISPSSRLNHAKTSLNRVESFWITFTSYHYVWVTFLPLSITFESHLHRVISLKTLKQKLFTCSTLKNA